MVIAKPQGPEAAEAGEAGATGLAGFFREHAVARSRLSRPLRWVVNVALVQIVAAALLIAEEALGLPWGVCPPALALVLGAAGYATFRFDHGGPGLPVGRASARASAQAPHPVAGQTPRGRPLLPPPLPRSVVAGVRAAALVSLVAGGAALLPLLVGLTPQRVITLDPGTTVPTLAVLAAAFFFLIAESLVLVGASVARWPVRLPVVTLSVAVLGALAVPSLLQAATSGATPQRAAVGTQLALLLLLWLLGCWGVPLFVHRPPDGWLPQRSSDPVRRASAGGLLPVLWWSYLFLCLAVYYAAFIVGMTVSGGGAHTAVIVATLQTLLGLEAFSFVVLPVLLLAGTDFAEMGIVAAHSTHQLLDRLITWRRGEGADSWAPAVLLGLTFVAALHGAVVLVGPLGRQSSGLGPNLVLLLLAAAVAVGGIAGVAALARRTRRSVAETVPYWPLFATSVAFAVYTSLGVVSLVWLTAPFLLAAALAAGCGVALVLLGPRAQGLVGKTGPAAGVFLVTWGVLVPIVLWAARLVGAGAELGTADYQAVVVEVSALQVLVGAAAAIGLPLLASATGWSRLRAVVRGPVLPLFVLQAGLQVLAWMAAIYHGAEGAGDQVGWARALVLGAALLWDALLCGSQITNVVGARFPRAARVPIYYGLLIGVSTTVLYFASWRLGPDARASGLNFQLYLSTERFPMIGLALFGVPMLVAGAIAALLIRERSEGVREAAVAEAAVAEAATVPEQRGPAGTEVPSTATAVALAAPLMERAATSEQAAATALSGVAAASDGNQERGAGAVLAPRRAGPRAPFGVRGVAACGMCLLATAVVLGSALGLLAIGRGPAAPIGSVQIGLDVGYVAHGRPIVVDPRTVFDSGDSFGFVATVASGRTFNTSSLTMIVDTRSGSGAVTQVTVQSVPAQPAWTSHAYRLNPIDDLMGACHGTQFTFVLRDNAAELGAANFTYRGCGHTASGRRGHLVFGASALTGADGVTTFIARPASVFAPGEAFTVVVVASAPLTSRTVLVELLQRAADGTAQIIYVQQAAVPNPGQTTSFALQVTPIDSLMANCNPAASQTYVFDVGVGATPLASGSFVYTGCGTTGAPAGAVAAPSRPADAKLAAVTSAWT